MPATVEVGGQSLVLNGAALRKKSIVKVYVAGLYLPAKSQDANAILASDGPRELRMQFVRDVGKDKMCEAWDESLKNNTPDADAQLQGEFKELCGWMQDLKKGDVMSFTYVPATGTTVDDRGPEEGHDRGEAVRRRAVQVVDRPQARSGRRIQAATFSGGRSDPQGECDSVARPGAAHAPS